MLKRLAVVVIALAPAIPARAQSVNGPPPSLTSLIDSFGSFGAHELDEVARGDVAVVTLHGTDKADVALLALVSVAVPRAFYATHAWDADPERASGTVHDPAGAADFAGVSLTDAEVRGLRRCRPLHCGVKLPASEMTRIARVAESSAATVDSAVRQWLADRVNDYHARGDSALPRYDDTKAAEESAAGFLRLLDESAPFVRDVPGLAQYLRGSPSASLPGVVSTIHWTVDHPEGLTPIASVVQRTTCTVADPTAPTFMIVKQLYATHYFDARLDVTAIAEGAGETPDTYALVVRRLRFDKLPSGGMFDIRGRVTRKLRNALREELAATKRRLESSYRQ